MKLNFTKLETQKDTIDVSFDNGITYTTYNIADIKNDNNSISFTEDQCSDLTKIKVRGAFKTFSDFNVTYTAKEDTSNVFTKTYYRKTGSFEGPDTLGTGLYRFYAPDFIITQGDDDIYHTSTSEYIHFLSDTSFEIRCGMEGSGDWMTSGTYTQDGDYINLKITTDYYISGGLEWFDYPVTTTKEIQLYCWRCSDHEINIDAYTCSDGPYTKIENIYIPSAINKISAYTITNSSFSSDTTVSLSCGETGNRMVFYRYSDGDIIA